MVGTGGNLDDVLACGSAKAGRAITRAVEAPAMAGAIVWAHARPNVGAESRVGRRDEDVARVAAVARAALPHGGGGGEQQQGETTGNELTAWTSFRRKEVSARRACIPCNGS